MKPRSLLRFFLRVSILALLLVVSAAAQPGTPPAPLSSGVPEEALRDFQAGRYAQAADILRRRVEGIPSPDASQAALFFWLGRCYFELSEFARAVQYAEKAVQLEPAQSGYHQLLGRAYGRRAEESGWFSALSLAKKTRREFEEAVRLDPRNFEAQRDLIEFYFSAPGIVGGGDEKARRQAEALVGLDPGEGHAALGAFWTDKKNAAQAEAEFRKALEAKPRRVDPYLDAADFFQDSNKPAAMLQAVEAAARADPSDPRLDYHRAVAYVLSGERLAEAERLLKLYLENVPRRSDYPSHPSALEWLGRLYEKQGKPEMAAQQYRAALQIDPKRKFAREALKRLGK